MPSKATMFTVVGEQVKQETLTIKDEYSPNNSVTSGHLLRTERRKAAVTRQTRKSTNRNLRIYQNIKRERKWYEIYE